MRGIMAQIIDGKKISQDIKDELKEKVTANMKYIGIVTMNVFLFSFLSHAAIASRDRAASIWFAVPKIGQIVR